MKTKSILLLALLMPFFFNSCQKINGKGDVVRISRAVEGYTGIELSMDATVYFIQGDICSLEIEAQENLMEYIETVISGNNLVIREEKGVDFWKHDPIRIYITAPDVNSIDISGSGTINVDHKWMGDHLSTNISGSGDIDIDTLQSNQVSAEINGSGSIEVHNGFCNYEDFTISGSGSIDMRMVECDTNHATISGSGDIYANIKKLLEAAISGSGNIYYYGTPAINTHISGSGNIQRL